LLAVCPEVRVAFSLTERFTSLLRERRGGAVEAWPEDASTSGLPEFHSFATGLRRDQPAIVAAVALPYSNGQTEGQITKLELLKRSMYGRASFELLRRRVLLAA
jgi:transposase